jgi:UDP-N-acetylglucosamine diphosphorylase/glucosamine-1-phosphate N-acetyltransferase
MTNQNTKAIAAIILAAGKGKRMQMQSANKVTVHLAKRPLIVHIVEFMEALGLETIVTVVGYHKESVQESLKNHTIHFVEQKEQLGTGHAVECAIKDLPEHITDVLVAYGDDAVLYSQKNLELVNKIFELHKNKHNVITFLTIEQDKPVGLGRIVRDEHGNVLAIMEEKDASDKERTIKEINPGCFVFSVDFLKKYLPKLPRSSVTGEYYLTSLIDMAIKDNELVDTVQGGQISWRGVNTKEDLALAEDLYKGLE